MENTTFEKLRAFCLNFIIFSVPAGALLFILPYALKILFPFLTGLVIAAVCRPLFSFLLKRRTPRTIAAFLSIILVCALSGGVIWFSLSKTVKEISGFSENFTKIYESSGHTVKAITARFNSLSENRAIPDGINSFMYKLGEILHRKISDIALVITNTIIDYAKNIPSVIIFLFTALFSAFFILKDKDAFESMLKSLFGKRCYELFCKIKCSVCGAFGSYIKAQLIISTVIFFALLCGFFILRVKYALLFALLTAFVDAVPILGTGTVLIPWSLIMIFSDNPSLGWGLLTLYGVCVIVRQLCEPKIIGSRLGLHPLITIFSIYSGIQLFGFFGFIFGPVAALLIKNLINPKISS